MKTQVMVRFYQHQGELSPKRYAYHTDLNLMVGDHVLVVVGERPTVALVTEVRNISKAKRAMASKWIAYKIDLTEYEAAQKRRELAQELEDELDAEVAKFNRLQIYQTIAKNSPRVQALITQLGELDDSFKLLTEDGVNPDIVKQEEE